MILTSLTEEQKINLLKKVDQYARSLDKRISQVIVSLVWRP